MALRALVKADWTLFNDPGVEREATPLAPTGNHAAAIPVGLSADLFAMFLLSDLVAGIAARDSDHAAELYAQPVIVGTDPLSLDIVLRAATVHVVTGVPATAVFARIGWDPVEDERRLWVIQRIAGVETYLNDAGVTGELIAPVTALNDIVQVEMFVSDVGDDVQVQVDIDGANVVNVLAAASALNGTSGTWGIRAQGTGNVGDKILLDGFVGDLTAATEEVPVGGDPTQVLNVVVTDVLSSITITFDPVVNAISYHGYIGITPGVTVGNSVFDAPIVSGVPVAPEAPTQTYYFIIVAEFAVGPDGTPSEEVIVAPYSALPVTDSFTSW